MSDSPLFSVILPTCRRPGLLREAIESVLNQTVTDFEVIVVYDGSDEEVNVPDDPRVVVVRREQQGGPAAARNSGLERARGQYVTFLDDDDLYTPDRLEMALEGLERAPITICWTRYLDGPANPGRVLEGRVDETIMDHLIPHLGATTVARHLVLPFDEDFRAYQDVEWWIRLARQADVSTVRRHGHLFRRHNDLRIRNNVDLRLEWSEALLEKHAAYFRAHPNAAAFRWRRIGLVADMGGQRGRARRAYLRSLRCRPALPTFVHLARNVVGRPATGVITDTGPEHRGPAPDPTSQ